MHKEDVSQTALAFIAGATVGAGVMLLFAPQAGSDFRSSVREYARGAKEEWDQASDQGMSGLNNVLQRGREWIQSAMQKQHTEGQRQAQNAERSMGPVQQGVPSEGSTGQDA
jgi:gas vesicle protein